VPVICPLALRLRGQRTGPDLQLPGEEHAGLRRRLGRQLQEADLRGRGRRRGEGGHILKRRAAVTRHVAAVLGWETNREGTLMFSLNHHIPQQTLITHTHTQLIRSKGAAGSSQADAIPVYSAFSFNCAVSPTSTHTHTHTHTHSSVYTLLSSQRAAHHMTPLFPLTHRPHGDKHDRRRLVEN